MENGSFVYIDNNQQRIAKLISVEGLLAEIEHFYSIDRIENETVLATTLVKAKLERQTRCYYYDENVNRWLMGRIMRKMGRLYEVDFPDSDSRYLDQKEIYVRKVGTRVDPVEVISAKGIETAFFYRYRHSFIKEIITQRSAYSGMTALASSSVWLLPHQFEVVRRVLEDPVPRYILADEVGLGKTIEAGIIIRQFLLDQPDENVLIVVPSFLLVQWQKELEERCYINQFGNRIAWKTFEEISTVDLKSYGFIILDEAHELAKLAFSKAEEDKLIYQYFRNLAHASYGLLLLSATPVLNNENEYLAMLHLIDPDNYSINDLEKFRNLIKRRQEVGHLLVSFRQDARISMLKRGVIELRSEFNNDLRLMNHVENLEHRLHQRSGEDSERKELIRNIRVHLSESYRLHRRLIRNRRESMSSFMNYGRDQGSKIKIKFEYDLDERTPYVNQILDNWRFEAQVHDSSNSSNWPKQALFELLWQGGSTSTTLLQGMIQSRLQGELMENLQSDLTANEKEALLCAPLFDGEIMLLEQLLEVIDVPSEEGDRIDLLCFILMQLLRQQKDIKVVIFTSYTSVCREIGIRLEQVMPAQFALHDKYMTPQQIEKEISRFREDQDCNFLICDTSGEVGRNLQFADHIVHFDLPLSPNRIEQRIGRVDRIGRSKPFAMTVLAGPEIELSYQEAWLQLLDKSLNVFQQSISSLQFLIDEKIPLILRSTYEMGMQGFEEQVESLTESLEEEKLKIYEQHMLDDIDAIEQQSTDIFDELLRYDHEVSSTEFRDALEGWVLEALKFKPVNMENRNVCSYQADLYTLVPYNYLKQFLGNTEQESTYDREVAVTRRNTSLYRIGHQFVDLMNEYIKWDDRGSVFSFWRRVPDWQRKNDWAGFIFHYVVEGDTDALLDLQKQHASRSSQQLKRIMDRFYPPRIETVVVRLNGQCETEQYILDALTEPFNRYEDGGNDTNLTKSRLHYLDQIITAHRWKPICHNMRVVSEDYLRDREDIVQLSEEKYRTAKIALDYAYNMLELRSQSKNNMADVDLALEETWNNAILSGIKKPKVTLDSVGFIILTNKILRK
ncbi:hypothetical protein H8B09_19720 [Paenibacillus sp. PR3]|uniref:Uncharacterized protein n=1 Tax=Paenibacillus terricola TaxID=2763503 RepID=A0ABR8N3I0_9BACL|nr:protein DpdE [Paenibacillus terricola]MBD3921004.1 hypothetical protein [Paenibacillus terricola]